MDHRKNHCIYHPSETITNFCREKQCLLPLCPSCIGIHLKHHAQQNTPASIDNINDSVQLARGIMGEAMDALQSYKVRLGNLESTAKKQSNQVRELLFSAKLRIKELVDQRFAEIERDTLAAIEKHNREIGMHPEDSLLYDRICQQIDTIRNVDVDLKGEKCLATLITFFNQGSAAIDKLNHEASRQIEVSENHRKEININENVFGQIAGLIGQVLTVKLTPNGRADNQHQHSIQLVQHPPVFPQRVVVKRGESPQMMTSSLKHNVEQQPTRSFTPQKVVFGKPLTSSTSVMKTSLFPSNLFASQKSNFSRPELIQPSQPILITQKLDDTRNSFKRMDRKHGLTLTNEHRMKAQLPASEDTQLTFHPSNKENTPIKAALTNS